MQLEVILDMANAQIASAYSAQLLLKIWGITTLLAIIVLILVLKKLAGGNFLEEDLSEKLSCGIQGFLIRQFIYDFRIIKFFGIIVV